jgi:GYF domain 2
MAIETICKGCARKLRVDDEFAGRKARCPHCKTIYTVPAAGAGFGDAFQSEESTSDNWLLRTKDGTVYGPVSKSELEGWVREGRLDADSQIRRESEEDWRQAAALYPSLMPAATSSANPFAGEPTLSTGATNPYVTPRAAGRPMLGFRPHRGGLILTLSILGFACCQLFSVAAWVMGHADLKEINAGRMDPAGRGLTQAGMIIGIIGTVIIIASLAVQLILVPFAIMNG